MAHRFPVTGRPERECRLSLIPVRSRVTLYDYVGCVQWQLRVSAPSRSMAAGPWFTSIIACVVSVMMQRPACCRELQGVDKASGRAFEINMATMEIRWL